MEARAPSVVEPCRSGPHRSHGVFAPLVVRPADRRGGKPWSDVSPGRDYRTRRVDLRGLRRRRAADMPGRVLVEGLTPAPEAPVVASYENAGERAGGAAA